MKYELFDSFFNVDGRGNHKLIPVGTVIPERVYKTLTPQKQAKCRPVVTNSERQNWSVAELNHLIDLYLKTIDTDGNYDKEAIIPEHQSLYPTRGANAISMKLNQIRSLDTYVPQIGLVNTSYQLIDLLYSRNPNRFNGEQSSKVKMHNHLDTLIESVRG